MLQCAEIMSPEQLTKFQNDRLNIAKQTVGSAWKQIAEGLLETADIEKKDWENSSFSLGRIGICNDSDNRTLLQLNNMGLADGGEFLPPVITVNIKSEKLRIKFMFVDGYKANAVPYFTVGYEENNDFKVLSDLWLSPLSDGSLMAAAKLKREGVLDYFPLSISRNVSKPAISCLGISSNGVFGVTMSAELINYFDPTFLEHLTDYYTWWVDLDPENLSNARTDYQTYLRKLQQPIKTDLIEDVAAKFGLNAIKGSTSDEKPVIFDGDMKASLKFFNNIEKGLVITIKDIVTPKIISENFSQKIENIVRSEIKDNQPKGDLQIWVRERKIFPVILVDGTLAPFDVSIFSEPEKLAAILAKTKIA